jgi:SAM-dependent methyltransferase
MTSTERHGEPRGPHKHNHGPVQLDEEDWAAYAAQTELQGEVFMKFLTDTIGWIDELRAPDAPPIRRILDIGSGPGVAACELALTYRAARVTAVDSSPAMLALAAARAARLGLEERVDTRLAELPDGVADLGDVDVIWASMSLHHIGDEVGVLRVLRRLLSPSGLIAIAELADPTRLLPDEIDLGRPGLAERLGATGAAWFAEMRHGLPDSVESSDLPSMLAAAGFEVIGERVAHERFDPPLSDDARRVACGELVRARAQLGDRLDGDDRHALDILCDEDDPRGAMHRADLFMAASRRIVIGRPLPRQWTASSSAPKLRS